MHDERTGQNPALTELRSRLRGGLARLGIAKTALAGRAQLGRTTVHEAFQDNGPVPSARTVAALARALKLRTAELLELQRTAADAEGDGTSDGPGLGKPIGAWEPHALEVHPAGTAIAGHGPHLREQRPLPAYVAREHDRLLADVVQEVQAGHSRMVVLVGTSSTGKTRACWEAVQPLAEQGWRLWHPFDPTRASAALDGLHQVQPRTVVWLNEAQHYLGDNQLGEDIAAAVHTLLTGLARMPVLVLGTLWPQYDRQYRRLPSSGEPDLHSRVRELLAGRTASVPERFDEHALRAATALADTGDRLLADALTRASANGQVTQDLAGAPELSRAYEHGAPAARAVLEAAMDARRLGVGLHLPQPFLTDAAPDYLTETDYQDLTDDWAEAAFAELAQRVHGKQAPLHRVNARPARRPPATPPVPSTTPDLSNGPVFRLADYLEQHGRSTRRGLCPPASFWHAALTHLTHPDDLHHLTEAADKRHRLEWAHHLRRRAADHGSTHALNRLAEMQEQARDPAAFEATDFGRTEILYKLTEAEDQDIAVLIAQLVAVHGHTLALSQLAMRREMAGDRAGAEALLLQAADHGNDVPPVREELGRRWPHGLDPDGSPSLPWQ